MLRPRETTHYVGYKRLSVVFISLLHYLNGKKDHYRGLAVISSR